MHFFGFRQARISERASCIHSGDTHGSSPRDLKQAEGRLKPHLGDAPWRWSGWDIGAGASAAGLEFPLEGLHECSDSQATCHGLTGCERVRRSAWVRKIGNVERGADAPYRRCLGVHASLTEPQSVRAWPPVA